MSVQEDDIEITPSTKPFHALIIYNSSVDVGNHKLRYPTYGTLANILVDIRIDSDILILKIWKRACILSIVIYNSAIPSKSYK